MYSYMYLYIYCGNADGVREAGCGSACDHALRHVAVVHCGDEGTKWDHTVVHSK